MPARASPPLGVRTFALAMKSTRALAPTSPMLSLPRTSIDVSFWHLPISSASCLASSGVSSVSRRSIEMASNEERE